jgi:hypothetical protein
MTLPVVDAADYGAYSYKPDAAAGTAGGAAAAAAVGAAGFGAEAAATVMKVTASKDDTAAYSSAAADTDSYLLRDQSAAADGGFTLDTAAKSSAVAAEDCQPALPTGWQAAGSGTDVPEGPSEPTGLDLFGNQHQQQDAALMQQQQQREEEEEVLRTNQVVSGVAEEPVKQPESAESQPKQLHSTQQEELTKLRPATAVAAVDAAAAVAAQAAVAVPAAIAVLPKQPAATAADAAVSNTNTYSDFDSQASTPRSIAPAAAAAGSTSARDGIMPGDLPAHITQQQQQQVDAEDLPMGKIRLSAQGVAVTASANSHY